MDNQKLKGLITGWRGEARGIRNDKKRPELSNSEAWIVSGVIEQYASALEALIFMDEKSIK